MNIRSAVARCRKAGAMSRRTSQRRNGSLRRGAMRATDATRVRRPLRRTRRQLRQHRRNAAIRGTPTSSCVHSKGDSPARRSHQTARRVIRSGTTTITRAFGRLAARRFGQSPHRERESNQTVSAQTGDCVCGQVAADSQHPRHKANMGGDLPPPPRRSANDEAAGNRSFAGSAGDSG